MTTDEIRAEFLRWKANLIHTEVFADEEWSAAWTGWYAAALSMRDEYEQYKVAAQRYHSLYGKPTLEESND